MYLDVKIIIITSSEVSGELQDGVTILFLTTDQEPILTFINRGKVTINGKAILQYGSKQNIHDPFACTSTPMARLGPINFQTTLKTWKWLRLQGQRKGYKS